MATCRVQITLEFEDENGAQVLYRYDKRHSCLAAPDSRRYSVTAAANQALTVPSGAKLALIEIPTTAEDVVLEGAAGDVGLDASPSSNPPGIPALIPLGDAPTPFITNAGAGTEVFRVLML